MVGMAKIAKNTRFCPKMKEGRIGYEHVQTCLNMFKFRTSRGSSMAVFGFRTIDILLVVNEFFLRKEAFFKKKWLFFFVKKRRYDNAGVLAVSSQ